MTADLSEIAAGVLESLEPVEARPLRATAVRVGLRVLLIPVGKPIPAGAVVYGPAKMERVYETFYEETHCPHGHLRANYERKVRRDDGNGRMSTVCRGCNRDKVLPASWPWGAPALA